MKKVKLQIPTNEWQDIRSKYAPDDSRFVDQNAFTSGTKNIDTEQDGTIRKMKGGVQFATLANPGVDQHEAIFSDGTRHLLIVENGTLKYTSGIGSMATVTSGYSATQNFEFATTQNRVYFGNGVNVSQVYDKTATYGGVGYSVPQTKSMGAQVPGTAPTATIVAGAGVPAGPHTYKVTYLYYDFEESNGSAASNLVTVAAGPNQQVDLSAVPIGGYGVTARKIYRDNNDGVYILVGTISDNTTTTFSDNAAAGTTPIPTDNGIPPVFGQVKLFLDRLWMAQISGEPFTLYFSEVGSPDIVQSTNFLDCNPEDPIMGLYVYRGRLVVFNRRSMGQILGDTKDSFRYDAIEGSVGCIDNRTIQEVTLNGVPVLVWLSDKGFYGFNGSSIFYLSDSIEDLLNTNIKQTVVQRNQKVDTSDTDFNAGTASDGIDIAGGAFSTRGYEDGTSTIANNPRRTWNDQADWEGGDTLDNVATIDNSNEMTAVSRFNQTPATEGTKDNVVAVGGIFDGVQLETIADHTGESNAVGTSGAELDPGLGAGTKAWGQKFSLDYAGILTSFTMPDMYFGGGVISPPPNITLRYSIYSDNLGSPGTELYGSDVFIVYTPSKPTTYHTFSTSLNLSAGSYWAVVEAISGNMSINSHNVKGAGIGTTPSNFEEVRGKLGGSWLLPSAMGSNGDIKAGAFIGTDVGSLGLTYVFSQTAIPASGTWTSEVFDSQSQSASPDTLYASSSYPSGTSSSTIIEAGDALDFAGNIIVDESDNISNLNGAVAVTLGSRRYYRVKTTLITNDNRITPVLAQFGGGGIIQLRFSASAEWISEPIDTTGDSTVYNSLVTTATTPGGSTVTTEIRTAPDSGGSPGTWSSWVTFGSHTVQHWAQIRITMTRILSSSSDAPSIQSVEFKWTIVSNLVSSIIDTNTNPSGWDIFQTDFTTNGGTVVFELRSATTTGGLPGATWYTVTNGNFPTASLPTDRYIQWRSTLTSTDGNVPEVRSITTKWFIGDVANIRAASIFDSKNYYVALAEFGNDENNVIVQLDAKGKWRVKRGLGVNTLGFFFNEPYFSSSTSAVVGKFLESFQDLGTNIEIDIRTRAFDFSEQFFNVSEFEKVPESLILEGRGTGATYDVSYSLDNGETFTNFIDVITGSTTYTTSDDDALFSRVFRVDVDTNGLAGARTIMYRIHTHDEYDIKLHRIKATAFITRKEPIITG